MLHVGQILNNHSVIHYHDLSFVEKTIDASYNTNLQQQRTKTMKHIFNYINCINLHTNRMYMCSVPPNQHIHQKHNSSVFDIPFIL